MQHRRDLGCDQPEDFYPEIGGGDQCPKCKDRKWHDEGTEDVPRGHGRIYIGKPGRGFRTNRCPRSWATGPFTGAVQRAYVWSEKPGGAFLPAYGSDPPALLMDLVLFYSVEVGIRTQHEWEEDRKARDAEAKHTQVTTQVRP